MQPAVLIPAVTPAVVQTPKQGGRIMSGHRRSLNDRRSDSRPVFTAPPTTDQSVVATIDDLVIAGKQKEITVYFEKHDQVPARVGDWQLLVNIRRQDGSPTGRTVIAVPLSIRTRNIFKIGCLETLKAAGYSDEDAARYFSAAWRKKYVWVDAVISAVKEMIDAFQQDSVLVSYEMAGDPRRLANTMMVPKNPYQTSHAHFLVAVEMARLIIRNRNHGEDADVPEVKTKTFPEVKEMVAA